MRHTVVGLALITLGVSAAAQQRPAQPAFATPRFDLSVGYNNIMANAPPAICNCFGLNGGYVSGSYFFKDWLGAEAEVSGSHANNISGLGQDLTLFSFMAGPRVTLPHHRLVPFGEVLVGGAHGGDSYFPTGNSYTTSATSFAVSAGGGLDIHLTQRLAVQAFDVQYLHTSLPNGTSNEQNQLMIGAGLVLRFGTRSVPPPPPPPAPTEPNEFGFTCSTDTSSVPAGQTVAIVGNTKTEPDKLDVTYSWTSSGGHILGSGREVTVDTTSLPAGEYSVIGKARLVQDPRVSEECSVKFSVNTPPAPPNIVPSAPATSTAEATPPPPASPVIPVITDKDEQFRNYVHDVFFDVRRSVLKSDQLQVIAQNAAYLMAHPELRVLVSGFADERGGVRYNLALADRRANAARQALINAGVSGYRIQVVSFGKNAQICTASGNNCWRQNRRAAFLLHP